MIDAILAYHMDFMVISYRMIAGCHTGLNTGYP